MSNSVGLQPCAFSKIPRHCCFHCHYAKVQWDYYSDTCRLIYLFVVHNPSHRQHRSREARNQQRRTISHACLWGTPPGYWLFSSEPGVACWSSSSTYKWHVFFQIKALTWTSKNINQRPHPFVIDCLIPERRLFDITFWGILGNVVCCFSCDL